MDVRNDTTTSDSGLDESVELLIAANGQLQVPRSNSLHLEVLTSVACKLEHLGSQVLQDGGRVDSGRGANAAILAHAALQESVDTAHRELINHKKKDK